MAKARKSAKTKADGTAATAPAPHRTGRAALIGTHCDKDLFVGIDFPSAALHGIDAFAKRGVRVIVPRTVREIPDERTAGKPA